MLLTVEEFKSRAASEPDTLVSDLQDLTGRYGEQEAAAWKSSLPKIASLFGSPALDKTHLYFGGRGRLSLEYRLPASSSWCDMVLLGRHRDHPAAIVLELKDWTTRADQPGPVEGLMIRQGATELHPSDQVRGYAEYCRRFHSAVMDHQAAVHGCVIFTKDFFCDGYFRAPNASLTLSFPCFTLSPNDIALKIPAYFGDKLSEPDEKFALAFECGHYRQNRSFCRQVGEQILDPSSSPFELLDGQRKALAECLATVNSAVFSNTGLQNRKVIIIRGPPGSGKSVVAAKLWASMVTNPALPEGNVVFTTTSLSQNSNWRALFEKAAREVAGRGLVVKANEFIPCTTQDIGRWKQRFPDRLEDPVRWRDNLELIASLQKDGSRTPDMHYLVSIVDEAHALINPEHSDGRGQFGFAVAAGPQGYHIIRGSAISVFFVDPAQSFRERETTTIENLKNWAQELGADVMDDVSLEGHQFRCGGSKEYVEWVELLLKGEKPSAARELVPAWSAPSSAAVRETSPLANAKLEFRIFDSLFDLEDELRLKARAGYSVRLLASYAREWKTATARNPHRLPPEGRDFHELTRKNGKPERWSKIWNYLPRPGDYTAFIQAPEGSIMREDPLSEVGCPYAVRGFDFDFIGLLWLRDLQWGKNGWSVDLDHIFETGLTRHLSRARAGRGGQGPAAAALLNKIQQAYRILLTRAMKGVYLWFEDPATERMVRAYLRSEADGQAGEQR